MNVDNDNGLPKKEWFARGPDKRTREYWDHAAGVLAPPRRGGPTFSRFYVTAFGVAALLGLICGLVVVLAGLWHFHVHPLW